MFVTTAGRTNEVMKGKATRIAQILGVPYIPRRKQSVQIMQEDWDSDCLVVGKERLELYKKGSAEPFFFHPNSAMFRIKRILNGENDPFADAAELSEGMSVLDCTLGLASDAIVASSIVGCQGKVIGLEGQMYLAYLVSEGLKTWDSGTHVMNEAMRRIQVIQTTALNYLKSLPSDSFHCVYFDPMFEEKIVESDGIKALATFASYEGVNDEVMEEAIRVATNRVVLKDHYRSNRFDHYGFTVNRRKTAKFHFGYIQK